MRSNYCLVLLLLLLSACSPRKRVIEQQTEAQQLEQQLQRLDRDSLMVTEQGDEVELMEVEWWGVPPVSPQFTELPESPKWSESPEWSMDSLTMPHRVHRGGYRIVKMKQKQSELSGTALSTQKVGDRQVTHQEERVETKRGDPPMRLHSIRLLLVGVVLLLGLFWRKIWALRAIP